MRSPPVLPLDSGKSWVRSTLSLTTDCRQRLNAQRECHKSYLDEEMRLQKPCRELNRSRPWRVWSSGEWCWYCRFKALGSNLTPIADQRKVANPKTVYSWNLPVVARAQHAAGGVEYWIVRWSTAHLRPLTAAEQTLSSFRDSEANSFQHSAPELTSSDSHHRSCRNLMAHTIIARWTKHDQ